MPACATHAGDHGKEESMRKRRIYAVLLAIGALGLAWGSYAIAGGDSSRTTVRAPMNGYQEPPSISTTGNGRFVARIDDRNQLIEYELTYSDLEGGAALFAHIHLGQRSVNGGVSAFLCGGGDKPPCPSPGGTVTGVIDASDVIGPSGQGIEAGSFEELTRAMRVGHTYANVHTQRWPGGEIRGQINDRDQKEFVG
jgi:hypothetical protein